MKFGYLNVHSHYSLLRGIAKVPKILEKAKEMGCDTVALTDTHNMYGAVEFYKKAKDMDMRPILGVTLFIQETESPQFHPIVLLAENKKGYHNILMLITMAHFAEGNTPFLTYEQIAKYKDGIIALLPALYNPVQQALAQDNIDGAKKYLKNCTSIFTNNNVFLGISPQNPTPKDGTHIKPATEATVNLAKENGVGVIPLPLVYLLNEDDTEGREVLLRIQSTQLSPQEDGVFEDPLLLPQRKDIEEWVQTVCPESLETLDAIIKRCDWELELGTWVFPTPPVPEGADRVALLREYIDNGYEQRGLQKTEETEERIETELRTIVGRGYTDYFLSVIDLIRYMHKNGILTTTRGSAAGSMVSYLAGITNVNPIEYQLPFERFLNPFRPSPPDVDLDIADNRRNEVIDYITERFGKEKVAQIGTLGTMMARAAVRDTARALGYSYMNGDRIARLIPMGVQGSPMYIDKAMDEVSELKELYESDETARHIITVAKKIEGNARHISVHAAGVVISPTTIVEYTPLEQDPKGITNRPVTQYNMHAVEDAGMLKFDILGLTNLAILAGAVALVKKDRGEDIDVEKIPMDDPKTFTMISRGYTTGVFQLGGDGMTAVLKKMKPTTIHDIAAIVALYRPGPMRNIDEYIERKQGRKPATYLHPDMEKYLKNSYGVLVYQDDLLYTAIEIAGYNWKEVDVFRKAVGKKIPELMAQQEKIFKERVRERTKMPNIKVDKLWNLFDPFKGYGFNKAHAMSYAKVAYQTAYMKAHFPAQYMTAHLNAVAGETENVSDIIYESKRIGLKVLPPGLNESEDLFTTEKNENRHEDIRIGLATIKQVGHAAAEAIMKERKNGGPYASLEDFFMRIAPHKVINRRNAEALIKVGVFDAFKKRNVLLGNIELLLHCVKDAHTNIDQCALFDAAPTVSLNLKPATEQVHKIQELYWEKELLGVYVSGHPLHSFIREGLRISDIKRKEKNSKVLTTAVIGQMKPFRNKSGEKMYFISLEDDTNEKIEAVCFPDVANDEKVEPLLAPNRPVKVRGGTTMRNEQMTIRIDSIEMPAPAPAAPSGGDKENVLQRQTVTGNTAPENDKKDEQYAGKEQRTGMRIPEHTF